MRHSSCELWNEGPGSAVGQTCRLGATHSNMFVSALRKSGQSAAGTKSLRFREGTTFQSQHRQLAFAAEHSRSAHTAHGAQSAAVTSG